MPDELDNEYTPIAETLWKLYAQLLRAGFERDTALEITMSALKQMLINVAQAKR